MNKNHFDQRLIYTSKLKRIKDNIQQLQQAQKLLDHLPQRLVQDAWIKIACNSSSKKPTKSKGIMKGPLKNTLRKTLHTLRIQQKSLEEEIRARVEECDETAMIYEDGIMEDIKRTFNINGTSRKDKKDERMCKERNF